jgi:hypothetical protein
MNRYLPILCLSLLVSSCSALTSSNQCKIPVEHRKKAIANINLGLREYSNSVVRYEAGAYFRETGNLNKDGNGCWSYIAPKAVEPGTIIHHGEGGIYVNPQTLEVGPVFWLRH